MRYRSLAGAGLLTTATLVLAAAPSLAPVASAGPPSPGIHLAWADGTPARLPAGAPATVDLTMVAGSDQNADEVVLAWQLANATFPALPGACKTTAVAAPSSVSGDGRRATCNLGQLSPGEVVPVALDLVPNDTAPLTALQVGDYVDAGLVLSREVDVPEPSPYYRLLSSPDFLNADVADLRESPWARWKPGRPNSWNGAYRTALDKVLSDWASFRPDAVTVPGDLVNGRWLNDQDQTGTFGPDHTRAQRRAVIRRAANTYYTAWVQRFNDHGLQVYAGLGDHDIGDNPWNGNRLNDEKRAAAPLFRSLFARYFTQNLSGSYKYSDRPVGTPWEGTAYAVRPDPEVELVMLDVFRTTGGDTIAEVTGGQLAWLESVLAKAQRDGVDWIVVEGHTPIIGPVRQGPSSGLMYKGGSQSALWKLFQRYGVDLYLCGEVHSSTAVVRDGIVQIAHGGNFGYGGSALSRGGTAFLVSDFSPAGLSMRLYSWNREHSAGKLWQMAANRIPEIQRFVSAPIEIGAVTISNDGSSSLDRNVVTTRTGILDRFDPATEPGDISQEWLPGS